jgi:hypothetical protein
MTRATIDSTNPPTSAASSNNTIITKSRSIQARTIAQRSAFLRENPRPKSLTRVQSRR